jgi:uncharacterized membrane-anchored protein
MNKNILLILFTLLVLAQLYAPASMILDREEIIAKGKEYKFKTAPIDPNDVFRGKYIYLNFQEHEVQVQNTSDYKRNQYIYVRLTTDSSGFAKIQSATKEKPNDTQDFVKAKIYYTSDYKGNRVIFEYPFERYYMEESKAPEAEKVYAQSSRDTTVITYATVFIKDGESVLKDVVIGGTSIKEIVKSRQNNHK